MENTKQTVTHYVASFKGVFGRNRSIKVDSAKAVEYAHGTVLDSRALAQLVIGYAGGIKAKDGRVLVRRYGNVEVETEERDGRTWTYTRVQPFDSTCEFVGTVTAGSLTLPEVV